jgi:two-component system, NarL family, invasion response regulator UvrY
MGNTALIKILVVDDHALIRRGMKQIFDDTPDLRVTGEAENGMQALKMVQENTYDLVLLDINMPDKNGIEVLKKIKTFSPHLPLLILSTYAEDQYALRAIKTGAAGYLNKGSAPEQLVIAIRQVASGKKYISKEVEGQLVDNLSHGYQELLHQKLSNREYQTLCLIASGKKLSEMAEIMSLSVKTVSEYRARLLVKMNLKNNAEAIQYAITHNLIL